MTGEEMERAIEFLLRSQANFEARLDRSQADFEARLVRLETGLEQTNQNVAEMSKQLQSYAETQTEFIQIVGNAIQGLTAAVERTNENLVRTDERLNNLAGLVERIITEGRNNGHA